MDRHWSWQRIPAEYLVTNVKLCRDGKVAKRAGYLHVRKGRVEGLGVGKPSLKDVPVLDGAMLHAKRKGRARLVMNGGAS